MKFRDKPIRKTPNGFIIGGIYEGRNFYTGYHWRIDSYTHHGSIIILNMTVMKNVPHYGSGPLFDVGAREITGTDDVVSKVRVR
jgi:hypothetical protein